MDIANAVGLPEARLALADAVVLVATSPKSNSAHDAINAAIADVQAAAPGPFPASCRTSTMTARTRW